MLILPIKRKWFDMIKSGEKKEEYREIKLYWFKRFSKNIIIFHYDGHGRHLIEVILRNGYNSNSPQMKCKCILRIGQGKEEWGAEPNKEYYVLEILEVLNSDNY